MDTAAYLTRQGWRGSGHSLHPSGRGIAKPLLISKKNDVLGVGNRKNDALADQWWLKAFDSTLKQVNVGAADGASKPIEKVTVTFQRPLYSNALYSNFVKGEGLSGTQTPAIEPRARMDSIRQLDGSGKDGAVLESKEKGRDKKRIADHAGEGSLLVPIIASSRSGALANEMMKYSQRELNKKRKVGQVVALESSGEKSVASLETRPLVHEVEQSPRLERKIEDEPGEPRKSDSSGDTNLATSENGALDSGPPRKRRRDQKRLKKLDDVEEPESSGEKSLASSKMDSSDYEGPKDSGSRPKVEVKSGRTKGQEQQPVEISGDDDYLGEERSILSKLEEQLSIGTTAGQQEQAQSRNGQHKQLGEQQPQLTKQEIAEVVKMRKQRRKLRRARRSLEKDLEKISLAKNATLSQVADDLSKDHKSALEWNRAREQRIRNRVLGDDAEQPNSYLPLMAKHVPKENKSAPLEKNRARKPRRRNRILGDDGWQPTSSLPPMANHMSRENKSAVFKEKTKRLAIRPSGKHVYDTAKTSKPLSGAVDSVSGEGNPASRKTFLRNERYVNMMMNQWRPPWTPSLSS